MLRAPRPAPALLLPAVSAAATYGLVVLGGAVRATGSGMGCPDWPLCKGKLGPLDDTPALWEQSHRYVVLLVTLLVGATAAATWRERARRPDQARLLVLAVAALLLQALLGAVTVWEGNAPVTVALHLGVGMLLLALLLTATVRSRSRAPVRPGRLLGAAALLTFVVLVSGATVASTTAHHACPSWPLCGAGGGAALIQTLHRALVLALVVVLLLVVVSRWTRPAREGDRVLACVLLALLAAQVAAGAFTALHPHVWTLRDLHLAVGAAVWSVVVLMAVLPGRRTVVLLDERLVAPRPSQAAPSPR